MHKPIIEIRVPGMIELYESLIKDAKFSKEETLLIINELHNAENNRSSIFTEVNRPQKS